MLQIRDVMTRDVLTVTPETTLREAADLFSRRHVSGAPVVAGEKVVGVVSATDLLEFIASNSDVATRSDEPHDLDELGASSSWDTGDALPSTAYFTALRAEVDAASGESSVSAECFANTGGPEWDALTEHTVDEVMTRKVCSLAPHLPLVAAADYMKRAEVHRLIVLEGGRLVGIVTSSDVTRAVAEHRLGERRYVFDRPAVDHRHDAGTV